MACLYGSARDVDMRMNTPLLLLLLLLLLVASLATVTSSASLGDYPSNYRCGETTVDKLCDPGKTATNRACSEACHYAGCGAGRCVNLGPGGNGSARGCHCLP